MCMVAAGNSTPAEAAANASSTTTADNILSDVWTSDDGITWHLATGNASWGAGPGGEAQGAGHLPGAGARRAFQAVTHGAKSIQQPYIMVMGGLRWMPSTAAAGGRPDPCGARRSGGGDTVHELAPVRQLERMPLEARGGGGGGGEGQGRQTQAAFRWKGTRDVWRSYDGVAWTEVTKCAEWGLRYDIAAVSDGLQLLVVGGVSLQYAMDGVAQKRVHSDVWQSTRHCHSGVECNQAGEEWISQISQFAPAPWQTRSQVKLATLDSTILLIGGVPANDQPPQPSQAPEGEGVLFEDLFGNGRGGAGGGGREGGGVMNDVWTTQQRCHKGEVGPVCHMCAPGK
jgi:hypothetical protein